MGKISEKRLKSRKSSNWSEKVKDRERYRGKSYGNETKRPVKATTYVYCYRFC